MIADEPWAHRAALERFSPMVRGVLRRGLRRTSDIDDALQDVFICLFRRVPSLRDPGSLRAFVLSIAFNTLRRERRSGQRRSQLTCDDESIDVSVASSSHEPAASYALLRLGKLLGRLGERERSSFVLSVTEGYTAGEAAETLGVSETTIRRATAYARARIRSWAERDPFLLDYFPARDPAANASMEPLNRA